MLDELKKLKYHGGKEGLIFFFRNVVNHGKIRIRDAEIVCSHAFGRLQLSVKDLISYCIAFGWIQIEADTISVSPSFDLCVDDVDELNDNLIQSTVEQLFTGEIFSSLLFSYDVVQGCYSFKNELLPLSFSTVRNVLISQGFMIAHRTAQGTKFFIAPAYESIIAKYCKAKQKQLSLVQLKKQLEDNALAGENAELFVLSFEKERIGQPLSEGIKRISEIDVSAGYDIISYNSAQSCAPDRFIEVKAIANAGFFWSKNEYEIAKLKGNTYYLYLVDLGRIGELGYIPEMIRNPATNVMTADHWFVEAQSYHIKRV